ncbi:DUF1328 domain-containing protein [Chitinispirillales bacterium ANBcel5]|uniref:DUF1328 family protein n=1 Tax=Cellulosispirillum alkaliphilum TaxID=3039283 RepID=UPI002A50173E|nr:DUF1328 domain-containing protein [Chitinispirillales bacterium ANBcel5]
MVLWAIIFAIIALIAGILKFTEVPGHISAIAKGLFFVFLILFVVSFWIQVL